MYEISLKVLLVTDDPEVVTQAQGILGAPDDFMLNGQTVNQLAEAVRIVHEDDFDVILLDLELADSAPQYIFMKVQKEVPVTPIIILSDSKDDKNCLAALKAGAHDYLIKHHVNNELWARVIESAVDKNRLQMELNSLRSQERRQANHDNLTGLPNRPLFRDRLKQAILHARRLEQRIGLLFLDLNDFKLINDMLGHRAGDTVLMKVASRLQSAVREGDTVARLGGDEFVILLQDLKSETDAAKVARKILNMMLYPISINKEEVSVTASIGISLYPDDGDSVDALLENADIAMYRAKGRDDNQFDFYLSSQASAYDNALRLEDELSKAIAEDQFVLHYQPQVDILSGHITGAEALIRWQHPEQGLLSPNKFIPLAEENGLIVPLGEWVIRKSCEQLKKWKELGLPEIRLSLNLSTRQFLVMRLMEVVCSAIDAAKVNPEALVLEITETGAMQNMDYTIRTLNKLRDLGIQIAMDDFGTGYASLNYLKRFPIDILKIDNSFIQGIHENHHDWAIVSAVVAMAKRLDFKVIAEGVEHEEQVHYLKALQCDEFQGFLASKPVPSAEFVSLFQNHLNQKKGRGLNGLLQSGYGALANFFNVTPKYPLLSLPLDRN